jgi:hypothetical protein
MKQTELTQGSTYIFARKYSGLDVFKATVLEKTEKTFLFKFEDTGATSRYLIDDFWYRYELIEVIENKIEETFNKLKHEN